MSHDELCPIKRETWCVWPGDKCATCNLIARVREDERKRAHEVIDHFDMFSDDRDAMHKWINGTPPKWAIKALGGER